jgi:hypothetical protein
MHAVADPTTTRSPDNAEKPRAYTAHSKYLTTPTPSAAGTSRLVKGRRGCTPGLLKRRQQFQASNRNRRTVPRDWTIHIIDLAVTI